MPPKSSRGQPNSGVTVLVWTTVRGAVSLDSASTAAWSPGTTFGAAGVGTSSTPPAGRLADRTSVSVFEAASQTTTAVSVSVSGLASFAAATPLPRASAAGRNPAARTAATIAARRTDRRVNMVNPSGR
jgi:hypothetical protein